MKVRLPLLSLFVLPRLLSVFQRVPSADLFLLVCCPGARSPEVLPLAAVLRFSGCYTGQMPERSLLSSNNKNTLAIALSS